MLNILYWNVYQKASKLVTDIQKLVLERNVSILVLAEICTTTKKGDTQKILDRISLLTGLTYLPGTDPKNAWLHIFYKQSQTFSITIVSDYSSLTPRDVADNIISESAYFAQYLNKKERMLFCKVTVNKTSFLLVPLHFPSRMYCSPMKQKDLAVQFKEQILLQETKHKLKSLVLGDFNMNPFEPGMMHPEGFFAVPSQELTENQVFYNIPRTTFYNPTWSKFGDHTVETSTISRRPSGSYFLSNSSDINYYWYLLDQVILRKELIDKFVLSSFDYLTGFANGTEFLKDDLTPNNKDYSDHLPIYFELKNF